MDTEKYSTFVVISEPRTGSTVISSKFGLIKGLHCQGEIFHPDQIYSSVSSDSIPTLKKRDEAPIEFLHLILDQTYHQRNSPSIIGFKLFFDHNPKITNYVCRQKIPAILLERRNKLAQYSSLKVAKKTGKWHSLQKLSKEKIRENELNGSNVHFSLVEYIAFTIRSYYRFNRMINKLKRYNCPYHYVEYENMFADHEWDQIVKFLNIEVPDVDIKPSLKKQRKGSLLDSFTNRRYAYRCCSLILKIPMLARFLKITPDLIKKSEGC